VPTQALRADNIYASGNGGTPTTGALPAVRGGSGTADGAVLCPGKLREIHVRVGPSASRILTGNPSTNAVVVSRSECYTDRTDYHRSVYASPRSGTRRPGEKVRNP
jgi:hypothetical protein